MPQPSSREWKPSTKQVIINDQKLKKGKNTKIPKPSKKKKRTVEHSMTEASSSDEAPRKRQKKSPDPEEISIGDSSEEAPEVVHISEECNMDAEEDIILLDGLKDCHNASLPVVTKTKADSTQDLLLVFSDRKSVTFKSARDSKGTLKGQWCNMCR
ncbi:hypothetical protein EDB89DRAFT_2070206 [Lactarius sanguifluus]|nr:hypothetical protein EDB89DRAFT_2070206 [Lactarius sanguifluus]